MLPLSLDVSANRRSRDNRRTLKLAGVTVFGLSALCWAGIGWDLYHFGANGPTFGVASIVGLVGGFNLWLGGRIIRGLREAEALRVDVDRAGVVLHMDNGATLLKGWTDPRTKLNLYTLNKDPHDGGPVAYLAVPGREWIPLGSGDATRTLEFARAAGVVARHHKDWIKYRGAATRYELRGAT